jgi:hypothetical protein
MMLADDEAEAVEGSGLILNLTVGIFLGLVLVGGGDPSSAKVDI